MTNLNVCTNFHVNPYSSCWDNFEVWTSKITRTFVLKSHIGILIQICGLTWGELIPENSLSVVWSKRSSVTWTDDVGCVESLLQEQDGHTGLEEREDRDSEWIWSQGRYTGCSHSSLISHTVQRTHCCQSLISYFLNVHFTWRVSFSQITPKVILKPPLWTPETITFYILK